MQQPHGYPVIPHTIFIMLSAPHALFILHIYNAVYNVIYIYIYIYIYTAYL